jgi:uncharacterized protein
MSVNKTPGVYVQEITKLPPSVAEVETAIPAFIGYTEKAVGLNGEALKNVPTRIVSLLEYEKLFGGFESEKLNIEITDTLDVAGVILLNRAIKAVAPATLNQSSLYYHMQLYFANGGGPCYIVSNGVYKTIQLEVDFVPSLNALEQFDEPTLICMPEAFENLNKTQYGPLFEAALLQCNKLKDRFVIADVPNVDDFRNNSGMNNLKYGAAYYPFLNSNLTLGYDENSVSISVHNLIKGVSAPTNTGALKSKKMSDVGIDQPLKDSMKGALAALYVTEMAPSGAIAGVYASVDNDRGVWKAPANVSLNNVSSLTVRVDDGMQDGLNIDATAGKSINAIRSFMGKGIMVWGSRTLAGNDNEWRYVPVRRFFNFVEESCQKSTGWAVFEPNDANTWLRVKAQLENFLNNLWRRGALQGAKPDHAYYVSIGLGSTMTAQDVLEGRMIVEIGMAAVRPAEFIILKFSHLLARS